jgi:hypothetical protein
MGRKTVLKENKIVPVTVHTQQFKVDKIGKENLKELLTDEVERIYKKL